MFADIICDPPLGHITVIPASQISLPFTVSIECDFASRNQEWEVALWYNTCLAKDQWASLTFKESKNEIQYFSNSPIDKAVHHRLYSGTVALLNSNDTNKPFQFTIKFRTSPEEGWKWVNEKFATSDGKLVYQQPFSVDSDDLKRFIHLESGFSVESVLSQSPLAKVWSVQGKTKAANGRISSIEDLPFGKPAPSQLWMSLVRLWSPWLAPRQGKGDNFNLDRDGVLLSFLLDSGHHLVLLAVSGVDDVLTTFTSGDNGEVRLSARNDSENEGITRIIIAIGDNYDSGVAAVIYHARDIVMNNQAMTGERYAELKAVAEKEVKPEWLENWYDGITYCTWNGLGQNLTEEKIFAALDSLEKHNVHITNLIIDDNWQSLNHQGEGQWVQAWMEFEANKKGFPHGLKHTISEIRKRQPNIQHVAVWHALAGYWGGIAPEGKIAAKYKTIGVVNRKGLSDGDRLMVSAEDVGRLYDDFYRFLSDCGVDSVKTDAQFYLDELEHADDRRSVMKPYQDAWMISSLKWFSVKAISCMSQIPQMIFHSQLPSNKPRILCRNSDDFYPEVPASHPWHIFCNAHNTLLNQYLNILPDWDMFQTDHPWAGFHGAARCVSGGPIYFTDEPGKHDIGLINQMTAITPRGNTVILRPDCVGSSMEKYVDYQEEKLLKVGTFVGTQGEGNGILGIFNINQKRISELLALREFPGILSTKSYIVRAHTTGKLTGVIKGRSKTASMGLDLGVRGWEILTAYPLKIMATGAQIAVLGLLGQMTGSAAVLRSSTRQHESGKIEITTSLKALGVLGLYVSNLDERKIVDSFLILIFGRVIPRNTVTKDPAEPKILRIDVATAWKEMSLSGGLSNEVDLQIYIG